MPRPPSSDAVDTFLPLSPVVFHILASLVGEARHGYGIMQDVAARTDGSVRLGAGTLYGALKRLLSDGLVEEAGEGEDPNLGAERRRYYRVTALGVAVVRADARRMAHLVRLARSKQLLTPGTA